MSTQQSNTELTPGFIIFTKEENDLLEKASPKALTIYYHLKKRINHKRADSMVFPGGKTLLKELGYSSKSKGTLSKTLRELEGLGLIQVDRRYNPNIKKWETNKYYLVYHTVGGSSKVTPRCQITPTPSSQITPRVVLQEDYNQYEVNQDELNHLTEENSKTETSEGKPPSSSLVDNSSSLKEDKDNPVSSIFKEEYDSGLLSKEEDISSSNPSRIDTQDVDTSLVSIEGDKNFREVIKMNTKQGIFKFYRDDPNFDNYLVLGCKVELEPVAIGV